jgi:hypothetical protein
VIVSRQEAEACAAKLLSYFIKSKDHDAAKQVEKLQRGMQHKRMQKKKNQHSLNRFLNLKG